MEQEMKKPIYKKWWFWLIIVVVVLGIVGGIGGAAGGGKGSQSVGSSKQNVSESEEKINNSHDTSKQEESETVYGFNDLVSVGKLDYIVTSAYNTKQIGSFGTVTENNYVVVTMKIKNNDSSEKYLSESNFNYYRGTNKYGTHNDGIYLENGFWLNTTIGAGISKTIQIVYEIPSNYESTDYILLKNGFKSEKVYLK